MLELTLFSTNLIKKRKIVCDKGLLLYGLNLQQLEQFIKANVYTVGTTDYCKNIFTRRY